jgi:hypothetical protein
LMSSTIRRRNSSLGVDTGGSSPLIWSNQF